jgi:hypothetical protein
MLIDPLINLDIARQRLRDLLPGAELYRLEWARRGIAATIPHLEKREQTWLAMSSRTSSGLYDNAE